MSKINEFKKIMRQNNEWPKIRYYKFHIPRTQKYAKGTE